MIDSFLCYSRERNRMHAKMTRDRKKNFIATIEKTIEELERDCQRMRHVLNKVGAHDEATTAAVSPTVPTARLHAPLATPNITMSKPVLADTPKLAPAVEQPVVSVAYSLPVAAVAPLPTAVTAIQAPRTPTLLASPVAKLREPALQSEELAWASPTKRVKVAHGFSWE